MSKSNDEIIKELAEAVEFLRTSPSDCSECFPLTAEFFKTHHCRKGILLANMRWFLSGHSSAEILSQILHAENLSADELRTVKLDRMYWLIAHYLEEYHSYWETDNYKIPYYINTDKYKAEARSRRSKKFKELIQKYADAWTLYAPDHGIQKKTDENPTAQMYDMQDHFSTVYIGKGSERKLGYICDAMFREDEWRQLTLPEEIRETEENDWQVFFDGNKEKYDRFKFLRYFGIGIDCSGYVSRSLSYVMCQFKMSPEEQRQTLGKDRLYVKTNATTLRAWQESGSKRSCELLWAIGSSLDKSYVTKAAWKGCEHLCTESSGPDEAHPDDPHFLLLPEKRQLPQSYDERQYKIIYNAKDKTKIDKICRKIYAEEFLKKIRPGDIVMYVPVQSPHRYNDNFTSFHILIVHSVGKDSFETFDSAFVYEGIDKIGPIKKTHTLKSIRKWTNDNPKKVFVIIRPHAFREEYLLERYDALFGSEKETEPSFNQPQNSGN